MVDNQHRKISGYRDLTQEEIDLINKIKVQAEITSLLIDELRDNPQFDQRWVSIGMTDLQTGYMALIRAVARPTTF